VLWQFLVHLQHITKRSNERTQAVQQEEDAEEKEEERRQRK